MAEDGEVGKLAAEIASLIEGATNTRAEMLRAATDLEKAAEKFGKVSKGTNRRDARAVPPAWRDQARELRKAAAEVEDGIKELTAYLTELRGQGPNVFTEPTKTGEELVEESKESELDKAESAFGRLMREGARGVGDVNDVTDKSVSIIHALGRPSPGSTTAGTQPAADIGPQQPPTMAPNDIATTIVATGIVLGRVVDWTGRHIKAFWKRRRSGGSHG